MTLLILGIFIWSGVHLFKRLVPDARQTIISVFGNGAYQGIISVLIVVSIILMVFGWRSASPTMVYTPPAGLRHVAMLVITIGFIFLGCAKGKNYISSRVRHPMLTGVCLWAIGHLMANGDSRSVVLFGGMLMWAVVEIYLINFREGAWDKPEPQPASTLLRPALLSIVIVAIIVIFLHPYLAGVPLVSA